MSILVNGSPTEEINVYRGLKQGDLLSLFCSFWWPKVLMV
jgi:hypothetical protein